MEILTFKDNNNEQHLICPECGCEQTHLVEVEQYRTKASYEKRLCVKLHFKCENLCEFSHDFYNHKGDTIIP